MRLETAMIGQSAGRAHSFDAEKATAAISFLVSQTDADLYSVMKMLYLADKAHLAAYGRTVTGDSYVAMKNGPVPDRSYNLCKFVGGIRSHFDPMPNARELLALDGNNFKVLVDTSDQFLSVSDLEALEEAAAIYRAGGWRAVRKQSHDAAWDAAWADALARGNRCNDMELHSVAATLPNGAAVIEFLSDKHPGEAELVKQSKEA